MGLLKKLENKTAYAKIGIMGFAGSGKTFTASTIALELAKKLGEKSVAFFDTEKGSDFLIKKYKENGVDLIGVKSQAFADLIAVMKECEKEKIKILIIDSISHVWRELCESYQKKAGKKSLSMYDWGIIKKDWKTFTTLYINSPIHIFMLGRAGHEYEQSTNEDTGKKEMIKASTKMKNDDEATHTRARRKITMSPQIEPKKELWNSAWPLR